MTICHPNHPVMSAGGWLFAQDLSVLRRHTVVQDQPLAAIRRYPRIWILSDPTYPGGDAAAAVRAGCHAEAPAVFLQFQVEALTDCPTR